MFSWHVASSFLHDTIVLGLNVTIRRHAALLFAADASQLRSAVKQTAPALQLCNDRTLFALRELMRKCKQAYRPQRHMGIPAMPDLGFGNIAALGFHLTCRPLPSLCLQAYTVANQKDAPETDHSGCTTWHWKVEFSSIAALALCFWHRCL